MRKIPKTTKIDKIKYSNIKKTLKLKTIESDKILKMLLKEKINNPMILRDHRERGPIYHSIIFNAAKKSPEIFGLPPLKMINYKGIYIADLDVYKTRINEIKKLLKNPRTIRTIIDGKNKADNQLKSFTKKMRNLKFSKMTTKQLTNTLREFLIVRDEFTKYSFYQSTIGETIMNILSENLENANISPNKRAYAFASKETPVEIQRTNKLVDLKRLYDINKKIKTKNSKIRLNNAIKEFMNDFADFEFTNFSAPLEDKETIIKLLNKKRKKISEKRKNMLIARKEALKINTFYKIKTRNGTTLSQIFLLFDLAGKVSTWESFARQNWTRAHRELKRLIEEIGNRAVKKGIYKNKESVYENTIYGLIKLTKRLD